MKTNLSLRLFALAIALPMLFSQCKQENDIIPATNNEANQLGVANTNNIAANGVTADVPLKNMFGINAFEWNFLENPNDPGNTSTIYEANMSLIKTFSGVRHYMDWEKLENAEGSYTFNPTNSGSWNYDAIYTRCKQEGITVVADLKTVPQWMLNTFPYDQQDNENVPAPFGSNLSDPASYLKQAKVGFQFTARYGYNANIDESLVSVNSTPRWTNDPVNVKKIGMGLVKYIECDNERDKWWKGPATKQTPEEYAANMSAFYDGDKGRLGPNAGVKTADPTMQVVMGGLATCDTNFVNRMISWCKVNRGYKADGTVNLCFDVINYHYYSNDGTVSPQTQGHTGVAPELSEAGAIADAFVRLGKANNVPVWVTEAGYDINQGSWQKAVAIGSKSVLVTQADWILRTALLYRRHGVQSLYFYMLFDASAGSSTQYATSGLNEGTARRPAADYILQTSKLMGNYTYVNTISADPLVDVYTNGTKKMYVLMIPDQKGRTATYSLNLGSSLISTANIYKPAVGATSMTKTAGVVLLGKTSISVSETPTFVEAAN